MATKMNAPVMENAEEDYEKLEPVDSKKGKLTQEEMHAFPISSATIFFQALMVLSAVYFSMLLTNWGNPTVFDSTILFFEANLTSFWIKLIAQWLSMAIYLFSMVAPVLFPGREF